ncbi:hypothetical protein Emag_004301 [Eimeria magna]
MQSSIKTRQATLSSREVLNLRGDLVGSCAKRRSPPTYLLSLLSSKPQLQKNQRFNLEDLRWCGPSGWSRPPAAAAAATAAAAAELRALRGSCVSWRENQVSPLDSAAAARRQQQQQRDRGDGAAAVRPTRIGASLSTSQRQQQDINSNSSGSSSSSGCSSRSRLFDSAVRLWLEMGNLLHSWIFMPPPKTDISAYPVEYIETAGRSRIPFVLLRGDNACPLVLLYSHGNAEDLGGALRFLRIFRAALNVSICCYDYTGYGQSKGGGPPSEAQIYADAEAAYAHLVRRHRVMPHNVVLVGRSLGTGPSTYLAAKHKEEMQKPSIRQYTTPQTLSCLKQNKTRDLHLGSAALHVQQHSSSSNSSSSSSSGNTAAAAVSGSRRRHRGEVDRRQQFLSLGIAEAGRGRCLPSEAPRLSI